MAAAPTFDLIVIGGGTAGFAAARRARARGASVAMLEEGVLGGECPNTACVPTKALLRCAEMLADTRRAGEFGVELESVRGSWAAARDRAARLVLATGTDAETEARLLDEEIAVYRGHAAFRSEREVEVGSQVLAAPRVVITTGSADRIPPIPGLAEAGFITHKEAIALPALPESLLILGAGPMGVEFSQIFAPFGVNVTLLSATPLPLPREDHEISAALLAALREDGITVKTGARVDRVSTRSGFKVASVTLPEGEREIEAQEILLAVGHAPVADGIGLDAAGVAWSQQCVGVNATLRTSNPSVWAAGDCTGVALFTHVASYQGKLAADNAFADRPSRAQYDVIPRATFCRPEVASVGRTERELIADDVDYRAASVPLSVLERSLIAGERRGLAKLLVGARDGRILGAHVIGSRAGDLIHEVAVAMRNGVPASGIARTIHAFPTFAEIWDAVARRLS